jgi:hypothetical protein
MFFRFLLAAYTTLVCCDLRAEDTTSLLEQSLNDYISTFRVEASLLTDKIRSQETKRSYLKMVEEVVMQMQRDRKAFEDAAKQYFAHSDQKEPVGTLRLALSAKEKEEAYLHSVLFSNTVMFGLCSFTQSYADESVDKEMNQITAALISLGGYFREQIEGIMKRIEEDLRKTQSPI